MVSIIIFLTLTCKMWINHSMKKMRKIVKIVIGFNLGQLGLKQIHLFVLISMNSLDQCKLMREITCDHNLKETNLIFNQIQIITEAITQASIWESIIKEGSWVTQKLIITWATTTIQNLIQHKAKNKKWNLNLEMTTNILQKSHRVIQNHWIF